MSLKFGLYLVEQGIITCDQFCGLVKIQQESNSSLGTIAIQKNIMTIKQVATVLEQQEVKTKATFIQLAQQNDFIEEADAKQLQQLEQLNRPTIRQIIANVGLMTERQVNTLFAHYEKMAARGKTGLKPQPQQTPATTPAPVPAKPPQPKFKQRPVIVQQDYSSYYQ
jgi:hypothetical protein